MRLLVEKEEKKIKQPKKGEKMKNSEEIIIFFNQFVSDLKKKLLTRFDNDEISVNLSIVEKKAYPDIPDRNSYFEYQDFFARKMSQKEFWGKIDDVVLKGGSTIDFSAAFSPKNLGSPLEYVLLSKIYFRVGSDLMGEIDFVHEYNNKFLTKEFVVAKYKTDYIGKKHVLKEVIGSWENGLGLIMLSILDYKRDPSTFTKSNFAKRF